MKYFFKVRYGYKPFDFVSIEAGDELERAIYAWQTGGVFTAGEKMVNGNHIMSIEPHYHRYTGWVESYEPISGDDWLQIERDCPDFTGVIGRFKDRVQYLIKANRVKEIGTGAAIAELPAPA